MNLVTFEFRNPFHIATFGGSLLTGNYKTSVPDMLLSKPVKSCQISDKHTQPKSMIKSIFSVTRNYVRFCFS